MAYRVFDTEKNRWVKDNIYLNQNDELFLIKRLFFGIIKLLLKLDSNRYIYHRDINLYDKNGVLVFEGDFIRARIAEDKEEVGLVSYAHELSAYVILCVDSDTFYTLGSNVSSEIEAIGNVFDGYDKVNEDGKQALSV